MNAHPASEEDFDLLALGALDADEKQALESHLPSCPECERKLAEARGRIALLALAAPAANPSLSVKQQLMRRIHEISDYPEPVRAVAEPQRANSFGSWRMAFLAPIGVALAIATIFLWIENRRLDQQLANMQIGIQQQQQQLNAAQQMTELFASPNTIVVPLAAAPGMPKGAARVIYNPQTGLLVYDGQLESAPPSKSYQLWLVPANGNPISAGVFNPVGGQTTFIMAKVAPGTTPKVFAVTLEPFGGVPQPTGPKVLVGPVS